MPIKWIAKIIVAINSNTKPGQISIAIALAFLLGLIPAGNLLWISIFIFAFLIKINLSVFFISLGIFKLITIPLDGLLDMLGYTLIKIPFFDGFFTFLNNLPVVPFLKLNNTIVMGGLIVGLLLFFPIYLLFNYLLDIYRNKIREKIANSKFVKGFLKLPIVVFLQKIFGGAVGFYMGLK